MLQSKGQSSWNRNEEVLGDWIILFYPILSNPILSNPIIYMVSIYVLKQMYTDHPFLINRLPCAKAHISMI